MLCFYHCIIWEFKLSQVSGTKHARISQFWMFCKLHGILDKINKEKYDLLLYLALFANFGHQSMQQVLHGTLKKLKVVLGILSCQLGALLNLLRAIYIRFKSM